MSSRVRPPVGAFRIWLGVTVVAVLASCPCVAAPTPLRVVIAVDDEGTPGFSGMPVFPGVPAQLFMKRIEEEIRAVIEAVEQEGATEVIVDDTTGSPGLIDNLPANVRVLHGLPRPLGMAQAMSGGIDALILIGAHAGNRTAGAVFAHSMSPQRFFETRLNGKRTTESALVAAAAGYYNAPLIMISGDDKIVPEIQKTIDPNIIGVIVKRSLGWQSAELIPTNVALKRIVEGVHTALQRFKSGAKFNIVKLQKPIQLEMDLTDPILAEALGNLPLPGLEVHNATTIRYTNPDYLNIQRVLWHVARMNYGAPQPFSIIDRK